MRASKSHPNFNVHTMTRFFITYFRPATKPADIHGPWHCGRLCSCILGAGHSGATEFARSQRYLLACTERKTRDDSRRVFSAARVVIWGCSWDVEHWAAFHVAQTTCKVYTGVKRTKALKSNCRALQWPLGFLERTLTKIILYVLFITLV